MFRGLTLIVVFVLSVGSSLALKLTDPREHAHDVLLTDPVPIARSAQVELLGPDGEVLQCYDVVEFQECPPGYLAFVTTDGRRLFLQDHWRVSTQ